MPILPPVTLLRSFGAIAALTAGLLLTPAGLSLHVQTAAAQALVATANDKPITSYDVDMRMKMLRVLHQPAGRDDALESLIADVLKSEDTKKYGINPSDQDILVTVNREALKLKSNAQALLTSIQRAGVTQEHWHDHYKAATAWLVYVHALEKDLEVSENDVRAEIAKNGGKGSTSTEYSIAQVIFVVPSTGGDAAANERIREAQQLRNRFTDCQSGAALARGLKDVAVKDPVSRLGSALDPQLRDLLDHTEVGHLTNPQRTSDGILMVAVCGKSLAHDSTSVDQDVRNSLLADRLDVQADQLYKQLRAKAIVVKK